MEDLDLVRAFLSAWNMRDAEAIGSFLAEAVTYHNIPMEPIVGRDQVMMALTPFVQEWDRIDWRLIHIAANDSGVVLTERVDRFESGDRRLSVRVMGAFEITGGKIGAWRDYFDPQELQRQPAPGKG